jgi:tetratricopeptide (TPR) repeat protein
MPRFQRNDNFIDKTFTIIANIILKAIPTSNNTKKAFSYYRDGLSAQSEGDYAEALRNYYEALRLEVDPFDRSYVLYNIGLIHIANGKNSRALEYYFAALDRNPTLTQALENGITEIAQLLFFRAAEYWKEAIRLSPNNYIEAQNWLLNTNYNLAVALLTISLFTLSK